ncbi:MAG TPA: Ku protein [Polyangiaceae bacterium]|nr:Ku protein [Polyangiaceae bacterium]
MPRSKPTAPPEPNDEALDAEMPPVGARSFWSGTLTFGLVSIPVNLYSAYRVERKPLRMLSPEGRPLARRYYCPNHARCVPNEEITRGYEIEPGRFVVVTDEELEAVEPKKSREIELRLFVDRHAISPLFFERAYVLAPAAETVRAYQLLAHTLERTRKAGVATFVMRGKEHLAAVIAEGGLLLAETLRFFDEVRTPSDIGLPEREPAEPRALARIRQTIRAKAARTLDLEVLRDHEWERLLALAREKQEAGKDVLAVAEAAEEPESPAADIIDIMAALKASLAANRGEARPATPRGGTRRATRAGTASSGAGRPARSPKRARERTAPPARPSARSRQRNGAKPPAASEPELEQASREVLYERAKSLGIEGRSKMSKRALARAIRAAS